MPSAHEWNKRYAQDELSGPTLALTCEEYGFLQRLRDYCWTNNGAPNDLAFLQRFAAACSLSRYKFKKIWPVVENFFTVINENLHYSPDEQELPMVVEISRKRQIAGRLGAKIRWGSKPQIESDPLPTPMATAPESDSNCHPFAIENQIAEPDSEAEGTTTTTPDPSASAGGGGGPSLDLSAPLSANELERLCLRSSELGLAIPTPQLAQRLKQKLAPVAVETNQDWVNLLVRWPGQEHPGLWDSLSAEQFLLEARNQQLRKPVRSMADESAELAERIERRRQKA